MGERRQTVLIKLCLQAHLKKRSFSKFPTVSQLQVSMSLLLNISLPLDKMFKTLGKRGIRPSHQGYEAQKHIPWH